MYEHKYPSRSLLGRQFQILVMHHQWRCISEFSRCFQYLCHILWNRTLPHPLESDIAQFGTPTCMSVQWNYEHGESFPFPTCLVVAAVCWDRWFRIFFLGRTHTWRSSNNLYPLPLDQFLSKRCDVWYILAKRGTFYAFPFFFAIHFLQVLHFQDVRFISVAYNRKYCPYYQRTSLF